MIIQLDLESQVIYTATHGINLFIGQKDNDAPCLQEFALKIPFQEIIHQAVDNAMWDAASRLAQDKDCAQNAIATYLRAVADEVEHGVL